MTPAQEQALWEWAVAKAKQETEWGADSLYDFARARLLGALSVSGEAPPPEKGPRCDCPGASTIEFCSVCGHEPHESACKFTSEPVYTQHLRRAAPPKEPPAPETYASLLDDYESMKTLVSALRAERDEARAIINKATTHAVNNRSDKRWSEQVRILRGGESTEGEIDWKEDRGK